METHIITPREKREAETVVLNTAVVTFLDYAILRPVVGQTRAPHSDLRTTSRGGAVVVAKPYWSYQDWLLTQPVSCEVARSASTQPYDFHFRSQSTSSNLAC